MHNLADTFMHFEPDDENQRELYDAIGWALTMLKVQNATLTAYTYCSDDSTIKEVRKLATELLAACGMSDEDEPKKSKESKKPKKRKNPFRLIKGGK
jgi:hypothetical protein